MIARHWTGWLKPGEVANYEQHLTQHLFPELKQLPGYISTTVYRRQVTDAVEFLVITHWTSMEAIRQFAGDDPDKAVIPEEARKMMVRYDTEARHYQVAQL
ncbi:antibiotic biosynthesis monooxygenase family protein [Pontibacter liquoris]|uniref:antibiotic biosynthesis monooxygenase family protein n=1 Tax=Pontibacter liquoris TaxID=2905677 RepID=UPI001FA78EB7|nr:antibiotic biosynthesis monooxygenase [Pontibacter liquoris]